MRRLARFRRYRVASDLAAWIEAEAVRVLNVAGNRESTNPGIGARVEAFMLAAFRRLAP